MSIERDKYLTEAIGECWHRVSYGRCDWCNNIISRNTSKDDPYDVNDSFSTPDGFFKLFNWCKIQDWYKYFIKEYFDIMVDNNRTSLSTTNYWGDEIDYSSCLFDDLINPDKFANVVYNFLINKDN